MKLKKMLSLVISLIMLLSVCSVGAFAEEETDDLPVLAQSSEEEYVASDGSYVTRYNTNVDMDEEDILETLANYTNDGYGISPMSQIGINDSVRINDASVFPYSTCAYIFCDYGNDKCICSSGTVISNNMVLTTADILTNSSGKKPNVIYVVTGFSNEYNYCSFSYVEYSIVYDGWKTTKSPARNMSILCLNEPVGAKAGYTTSVNKGDTVTAVGYHSKNDSEDASPEGLYRSSGKVTSKGIEYLYYDCDTYNGQRGCAVFNSQNQIVAINIGNEGSMNYGLRITSLKAAWINSVVKGNNPVYRLYNNASGEHFYTASASEAINLKNSGWKYEGVEWYSPSSGTPVYRLYNQNGGEHFFTASETEKDSLLNIGWICEGIAFYTNSSCNTNVYRLYNPNAVSNNHIFVTDTDELDILQAQGWIYEGIGWRAINMQNNEV